MYCRVCDIEYPKALRFCKWCGGGLVDKEAVAKQHCPACGSSVNKEWLFCNECGVDLASLGAQPKDQTCPSCSASVRKGWMFCRQCGEQIATERAEQNCDVCGAGLREGWGFCKQCGAPAAGGEAGKPAAGQAGSFATIVGVPAVGREVDADEPFSGLASGELPALDDVISAKRKRGTHHEPAAAPPRAPDQPPQGGTHVIKGSRSTGSLDERVLEDEYASHPRPEQPPAPAPSPLNETISLGAINEPAPAGFKSDQAAADDLRTVAMPAVGGGTPPPPESMSPATVVIPAHVDRPVPPPPPGPEPTVALPAVPQQPAGGTAWSDPTVAIPSVPPTPAPAPPENAAAPPVDTPAPPAPAASAPLQPAGWDPPRRAAAKTGGGSLLKWITAAAVVLALLAIVAVAGFFVLRNRQAAEQPAATGTAPAPSPAAQPVEPATPPAGVTPSVPENMVLVEAGTYTIGSDAPGADAYSKPAHTVDLKAFFIDRTEVTNADFKRFVDATGHRAPEGWQNGAPAPGSETLPVVGVAYGDAEAYASWSQKRLPTEQEWEAAARGRSGQLYPWGSEWNAAAGNVGKTKEQGRLEPVGSYPAGASPSGAVDMIGNVWEWTSSRASVYPGGTAAIGEYEGQMVMRGSTFTAGPKHDSTWRGFQDPAKPGPNLGFRCVKDAN